MNLKVHGIYEITNKINGKRYVGQAFKTSIYERWSKHRCHATHNSYKGRPLYDDIRKYGIENFECKVCIVPSDDIIDLQSWYDEWEDAYIKAIPEELRYNMQTGGKSGFKLTNTKRNISKKIRNKLSDQGRKNISDGIKKSLSSPEMRQKIRDGLLGKKHSNMHNKSISAGMMGHIVTEETKRKISEAHKRRKEQNLNL